MSEPVRRVVTATADDGRGFVVSDGPSPHGKAFRHIPGYRIQLLGATSSDETHPVEPDRALIEASGMLPARGGTKFLAVTLPPATTLSDPLAAAEERRAFDPTFAALFEPDAPGFHRTATVDYAVVIEGEIWLELDDQEVLVRRGEVVVQNGTRHSWRNRSDRTATFLCVLVDVPES